MHAAEFTMTLLNALPALTGAPLPSAAESQGVSSMAVDRGLSMLWMLGN